MDSGAVRLALSYLHHRKLAPPALRPQALVDRRAPLVLMDGAEIDDRAALRYIPPLLKGYLFLGGFIGEGAVIDRQFNTTDVCVVLPVDRITRKYYDHYKRTAQPDALESGQPDVLETGTMTD